MGIPARLIEFLKENKVRYEVLHHPEAFTAPELAGRSDDYVPYP